MVTQQTVIEEETHLNLVLLSVGEKGKQEQEATAQGM